MANENENYKLNQSGPQVQALLDKIAALPNNEELAALLDAKQNVLIFDETPTEGSTNPVTSDGILAAIQAILSNEYVRVDTYADLGDPSQESMGKVYLVGLENAESFDRYVAGKSGDTYIWVSLGSTELDLSQYYTKEQTEALLEQELQEGLEPKANKDGYYSTLTAGAAENLVGDTEEESTFTTQMTGGEVEFGSGAGQLTKVQGNGLAWNQLIPQNYYRAYDATKTTVTKEDNVYKAKVISDQQSSLYEIGLRMEGVITVIPSHKYYAKMFLKSDVNVSFTIEFGGGASAVTEQIGSAWTPVSSIFTCPQGRTYTLLLVIPSQNNFTEGADSYYMKDYVQLTDLSLIFGLGTEPTTVADAEARLAAFTPAKPFYQRNTGELFGTKVLHLISYGQNLLNPANGQARLAPYSYESVVNKYGIAAKAGVTLGTITFTPDATGEAETITPDSNGQFAISGAGTLNVAVSAGSLADVYVWAVYDGAKDGIDNYVPFAQDAVEIKASEIYGKLNGTGDYVQVFADGVMRATGIKTTAVHDLIDLQSMTADVNVATNVVNLNNVTWGAWGDNAYLANNVLTNGFAQNIELIVLCDLLLGGSTGDVYAGNGQDIASRGYFVAISKRVYDMQTKPTVTLWGDAEVKKHYTDLKLSSDGQTFRDLPTSIVVDNWGVWQQKPSEGLTPTTGHDFEGIAATISTILPMDAVEILKSVQDNGIMTSEQRAQLTNILTALQTAGIIGGFTIAETPTNKVFPITVTAPTPEPEPEQEP